MKEEDQLKSVPEFVKLRDKKEMPGFGKGFGKMRGIQTLYIERDCFPSSLYKFRGIKLSILYSEVCKIQILLPSLQQLLLGCCPSDYTLPPAWL